MPIFKSPIDSWADFVSNRLVPEVYRLYPQTIQFLEIPLAALNNEVILIEDFIKLVDVFRIPPEHLPHLAYLISQTVDFTKDIDTQRWQLRFAVDVFRIRGSQNSVIRELYVEAGRSTTIDLSYKRVMILSQNRLLSDNYFIKDRLFHNRHIAFLSIGSGAADVDTILADLIPAGTRVWVALIQSNVDDPDDFSLWALTVEEEESETWIELEIKLVGVSGLTWMYDEEPNDQEIDIDDDQAVMYIPIYMDDTGWLMDDATGYITMDETSAVQVRTIPPDLLVLGPVASQGLYISA